MPIKIKMPITVKICKFFIEEVIIFAFICAVEFYAVNVIGIFPSRTRQVDEFRAIQPHLIGLIYPYTIKLT